MVSGQIWSKWQIIILITCHNLSCWTTELFHSRHFDKCPSKPWRWANIHNTRTKKLNGIQDSFILFTPVLFLLWHAEMSSVKMAVQGQTDSVKSKVAFHWFLLSHYRCDNQLNLLFLGEIKNLQTLVRGFSSTICRVAHITNIALSVFSITVIQKAGSSWELQPKRKRSQTQKTRNLNLKHNHFLKYCCQH